eukprot:Filipodium_phascolosomae@DN2724_c0_g1_i22.p1
MKITLADGGQTGDAKKTLLIPLTVVVPNETPSANVWRLQGLDSDFKVARGVFAKMNVVQVLLDSKTVNVSRVGPVSGFTFTEGEDSILRITLRNPPSASGSVLLTTKDFSADASTTVRSTSGTATLSTAAGVLKVTVEGAKYAMLSSEQSGVPTDYISSLGVTLTGVKASGNRWQGSHWVVHHCESAIKTNCGFEDATGKEISGISIFQVGAAVAGKFSLSASSQDNRAGAESEWTVTFNNVGVTVAASKYIYFKAASNPAAWEVKKISGTWVTDVQTSDKVQVSTQLAAGTASPKTLTLKVKNPTQYPSGVGLKWNVYATDLPSTHGPGKLIERRKLMNIGTMEAPPLGATPVTPTPTAPQTPTPTAPTAGVRVYPMFSLTPSTKTLMRIGFILNDLGSLAADKVAVHFKVASGWKVDANSAVLPSGHFAKKDGDTLSKADSLSKVEEWWMAGRALDSGKLYATQNTLHTPASGKCTSYVKVYAVDSNKVGALKASDNEVSDPLSKAENVFKETVTLDNKGADAETVLNVAFTTTSEYPKGTKFSVSFAADGGYSFTNTMAKATAQPDIKGCTKVVYLDSDFQPVACWGRTEGTGAWTKCTGSSQTSKVANSLVLDWGKAALPVGTMSFKIPIKNPSDAVIKAKVLTGMDMRLFDANDKNHVAFLDPINQAGVGAVLSIVAIVLNLVSLVH